MNDLINELIERDGISFEEAQAQVLDARRRVAEGQNPEEILREEFGLEPDFLFDLL